MPLLLAYGINRFSHVGTVDSIMAVVAISENPRLLLASAAEQACQAGLSITLSLNSEGSFFCDGAQWFYIFCTGLLCRNPKRFARMISKKSLIRLKRKRMYRLT